MAPSKTKHESLEFVFGDPLESLDPNIKPTTFNVIKHWIYHYDGVRGSKRNMNEADKNDVISRVVDSIISLPVYVTATLMSRKTILKKLKRDIYGKDGIDGWIPLHRRKNDQEWIEDRRRDLNEVYDIETVIHLNETVNLVSPAKRKKPEGSTEPVCKCFYCSTIFYFDPNSCPRVSKNQKFQAGSRLMHKCNRTRTSEEMDGTPSSIASFIILNSLYQDLSNEGSFFFCSLF